MPARIPGQVNSTLTNPTSPPGFVTAILDSKTESGVIQLSQEQLDDIIASKKEIGQGLLIENIAFEKEVKQLLNAK